MNPSWGKQNAHRRPYWLPDKVVQVIMHCDWYIDRPQKCNRKTKNYLINQNWYARTLGPYSINIYMERCELNVWDGDLFNRWAISPEDNGTIKRRLCIINNKFNIKTVEKKQQNSITKMTKQNNNKTRIIKMHQLGVELTIGARKWLLFCFVLVLIAFDRSVKFECAIDCYWCALVSSI